jgi:hypothetical protein
MLTDINKLRSFIVWYPKTRVLACLCLSYTLQKQRPCKKLLFFNAHARGIIIVPNLGLLCLSISGKTVDS